MPLLGCLVAIVGIAFNPNAAPANAYAATPGGTSGYSWVTAPLYVHSTFGSNLPWRPLVPPEVVVGRSASVASNQAQRVDVEIIIQEYVTSWIPSTSQTVTAYIPAGQDAVKIISQTMGPVDPGYYRAVIVIRWFNLGFLSGFHFYEPTVAADNVCNISACQAYDGYFQTW